VGLRAGLDRCGKSRPPPGFDATTVQPVASRYTDYAIPARYASPVPNFYRYRTRNTETILTCRLRPQVKDGFHCIVHTKLSVTE